MALDDGLAAKPFAAWVGTPDIKDMFRFPYPQGKAAAAPPTDIDPGRARNTAFFVKMYGDCTTSEAQQHLVDVAWLPSRSGVKLKVTTINGIAQKLAAIGATLDALPASFNDYLLPPAGTFACRSIAGTNHVSAHSYGIAIDIAVRHAHYWRWSKQTSNGPPTWRNSIPIEIVNAFERHGFIWGGRWHHFDTMHFEYRPELLLP
jgi:D-alanyl-D-alanine carboxypeptidase